jgi:RNA polymerase primary sigma factor
MFGLLTRWRRTERLLCREQGRAPTFDEIAAELGLTEIQKSLVAKARRASQLKLESSLGDDEGSWSPDESEDPAEAPEAALEQNEERAEVLRKMERLNERERQVLALRFGLMGEVPLTLKEIGRRLGVTREWVRKIELRAVNRLEREVASPTPVPNSAPIRHVTRSRRSRTETETNEVDSSPQANPSSPSLHKATGYAPRHPVARRGPATTIAVAS